MGLLMAGAMSTEIAGGLALTVTACLWP